MSHFSNDPGHVRVDFFKQSGKWYTTEQVEMKDWKGKECTIHEALVNALDRLENGDPYCRGMQVICLDPYHEHSHPICIKEWNGKEAWKKKQEEVKKSIQKKFNL